jgi:acetolactate synthase-1/2/3 large subunit
VRHEQAAVMMAHAWSLYTGKPGVCLVTAGPGFANTLTGVVNARLENVPVVVISGIAPMRGRGKGSLQEMDQASMIKSTVKWCDICLDVKRIPEYISIAFRHAVNGRPGPVYLELPPDILNIKVDEDILRGNKKGGVVYSSLPAPEPIRKAADLINNAKKPTILGGSGIASSRCDQELKEFITTTGIPFMLHNAGRGTLPDEHPLSLWDGGQAAGMVALSQADLVIVLGTRFNWVSSFGQGFPQAKVIRVDIEPTEIDRNRASDIGLVGDISLVLRELNKLVKKGDHGDWLKTLKDAYLPMTEDENALKESPSNPIHPVRLMAQVRKVIGDDAIYIGDGGDTVAFMMTGFKATQTASILAAAGAHFGCLGTGIPFGIGAKLSRPEKTVVIVNGDGSFGLNAMEFDTAVRHNIPIICVICNDQAWGMIKHAQEIRFGNDRVIGTKLGVVHYEKIVQALGGHGELVQKDEEIIPAIKRAILSGKPACINVLTDPTVFSMGTPFILEGFKFE